jgi:hypothetical protein
MTSIVGQQLIDDFDQRLRAQGVPWLAERPPGLTDEEIDRIAAPLGYALPEEVRRWYRWHNGSAGWDLVLSRVQTTLEEDVGDTVYFRDMDDNWRPGWSKVMNEKPYILFDCSSDPEGPVAVWHYDYEQGYPTRPVFDSIGEMLRFWIALIDGSRGLARSRTAPPRDRQDARRRPDGLIAMGASRCPTRPTNGHDHRARGRVGVRATRGRLRAGPAPTFLAIPITSRRMPSFGICNNG